MRSPTERFSDRVDDYVKFRPSYPPGVIDLIQAVSGVNRESTVADIGCGTGIFSRLLLRTEATIIGVEPNGAMLSAAEKFLHDSPQFIPSSASAESTGLPDASVDIVTAAQAFHWFRSEDARREFRRILKPHGWIFLVWNERLSNTSDFAHRYEELLKAMATDYATTRHRNTDDGTLLSWFQDPDAKLQTFDSHQEFDLESFLGRVYSSSYVPAADSLEREVMTQSLIRLFEDCQEGGTVRWDYKTKVFYGNLSLSA